VQLLVLHGVSRCCVNHSLSTSRRETPDKATRHFNKLQEDESNIAHGDWWKDSLTAHALEELGELDFAAVIAAIAAIEDVAVQWQLAIDYTSWCGSTISDVSDWGGKLVNGSMGEWCPETAKETNELWEDCLLAEGSSSKMPSKHLLDAAKQLSDFAGDYSYGCSELTDLFKAFEQRHSAAVEAPVAVAVAAVQPAVPTVVQPPAIAVAQEVIVID
jgi:hypothetical protein